MIRLRCIAGFSALFATVIACACSHLPTQTAGGSGSETVVGKALMPGGGPAAKAVIRLRSAGYLAPVNGLATSAGAGRADAIADDSGRFSVKATAAGQYCLEINNSAGNASLLTLSLSGTTDTAAIGVVTLEKTASVLGTALDAAGGEAQVFGLERLASVDSVSGAFSFSDLPAGTFTFRLVSKQKPQSVLTIASVMLAAGDVQTVSLPGGWTSSKRLYFNTTASGAAVTASVTGFPALIRLTGANFDFTGAQSGGGDLRFSKSDNTPLPYEIERWDPADGLAEAWVKVDTISGDDSAQYVIMYWGASASSATSLSNSASVFDTAEGFQGVWHLQESGKSGAPDATANQYDGVASDTAPTQVTGPIGVAQQFNGVSNYISMAGTAGGKLNLPENGTYSLSAWVKVGPFPNQSSVIVSKQLYQYTLQLRNDNFWEFHVFDNTVGFESTASEAAAGVWTHVEGVRSGTNQYFYVNGSLCSSIAADTMQPGNTTYSRITSNDVCVGRLPVINNPGQTWRYFTGAIEEVRISNVAHNSDWVKLCYMNQRPDDKLVLFK
ncbi:MAG: DUF2341 domain-containing protein [Chitinivibrionales bacterium]